MLNKKGVNKMLNIFEKKKLILTEWDSSPESKRNFKKAIKKLKAENIPFIVVLTDPTTGGVTASWAMLGDILIAEPKATIGFAGRRVIQDTVRETLPDQFQTAEYVKDHGGIDLVVERQYLNSTIGTLLNVLLKKAESQAKQDSNVTVDKSLQACLLYTSPSPRDS